MKRIFYLSLLLISLFSCQQTEFEFSCDPAINEFVLNNKQELSTLTVNELTSYELPLQKAVFRSWGYEKKREAWIKKLTMILNNNSFSEAESLHIKKLIAHINHSYFNEENISKEKEVREHFASKWLQYAQQELDWSDEFIAFMVYRLYINQYQFDSEFYSIQSANQLANSNSESQACNCNTSSDFCSGTPCSSNGCSSTSGCGWLWTETCNGSC